MDQAKGRWVLLVHGGAKEIAASEEADNRKGCLEALRIGAELLARGGSSVDAVEAAVRVLERLPTFNAGHGSVPNVEGEVEMCAGIMDGATLAVGAVGAAMEIAHPISAARAMLDETTVLVAGPGADRFAREHRLEPADREALAAAARDEGHDTVGAVALDLDGNLAAGTSTGGLEGQPKGRMGDSPMPGCGYYADNQIGAVALSGHGEGIARLAAAARIMAAIGELGPEPAIARTLSQMERVGGDAGGIAVDREGRSGWWHNSPHFVVAQATSETPDEHVWLSKDEAQ